MNRDQRTHRVPWRNRGTEEYGRSSLQDPGGKVIPFPKPLVSGPGARDLAENLISISLVVAAVLPGLLVSGATNDFRAFEFMMLGYGLAGSIGPWLIRKVNKITETTPIAPRASERRKPILRKVA
jgi:hypothetical protein